MTPLMAIIGDSFVEARQVENKQTMHGILSSLYRPKCGVYSFGASGAPLSQYLAYAEYAQKEFRPSRFVFIIVGNDFDESLVKYRGRHAFHYFSETSNDLSKKIELKLIDYQPQKTAIALRESALYRYLSLNLGIKQLLKIRKRYSTEAQKRMYAGNALALVEDERMNDSHFVVKTFFKQLPMRTGLSPKDILFILDGIRPHLYSNRELKAANGSYFSLMRKFFMKYAGSKGYEVIDMQPIFMANYQQNGMRFEFPNDGHWNELGHQVVADSIHRSTAISRSSCS